MTTPGATEAVTPEQDIGGKLSEMLEYCIARYGVPIELADAIREVVPLIEQQTREAETNALRRAADLADNYCGGSHTAKDHVLAEDIASAIRSLLPKEEGQAPDAPR